MLGPPLLAQTAAPTGTIRGTVVDIDYELPLKGVRIAVLGTSLSARTDENGTFLIENVPPGTWTLVFSLEGYERITLSEVVVAGQIREVRASLNQEVIDMDEMVVSGADLLAGTELGLLEVRAEALALQDAVSSELISQAGASDVAGALKLVTGTSIVDGKYAVVRGLADRYVGTTLNGVRVPSADPRRRAVQVDLFPTGTIDTLTVTKTFNPDLQGDFTGGGIDIVTRSIPDDFEFSISASLERDTLATGTDSYLTYSHGGTGPFGFKADDREIPKETDQPLPPVPTFSANPTPAQMQASQAWDRLVRSFEPVMGVEQSSPGPNESYSAIIGDRFESEGNVFGILGAATYSHKYSFYDEGVYNTGGISTDTDDTVRVSGRSDTRGVDEVLTGVLINGVWQPNHTNEISLKLIGNASAEDTARYQEQDLGPRVQQNQSLHYVERSVVSGQLHGSHTFEPLWFRWVGSWNYTEQDEPDVRFFRNDLEPRPSIGDYLSSVPTNSTDADNTRRIWRRGEEEGPLAKADVGIPFEQWSDLKGEIKAGLYGEWVDREYTQRSYSFFFPTQFGGASNPAARENRSKVRYATTDPGVLWTDVFMDDSRIGLASNDPPAPNQLIWLISSLPAKRDVNYTGEQDIGAAYAMADLPLTERLKVVFGARFESTKIEILPTSGSGLVEVIFIQESGDRALGEVPSELAGSTIDEDDVLPSVNLIWDMTEQMKLRASWSRTIARPTFRELAPVATEEFIFGDEFVGNPELMMSSITNYDLRWEWYRRPGEVYAASVFYKDIADPIELISFTAGERTFNQPVNYEQGEVSGIEVEGRLPLDIISEKMRWFSFGVNVAFIDSEVDVPEEEQESLAAFALDQETRRLQGQPDRIVNVNLVYDNEESGTQVGVFYNLTGEMLASGAARGSVEANPDVFETPFGILNATFSQKIGNRLTVSLKASNITTDTREQVWRVPSGEETTKVLRPIAALYSFGLKWAW